MKFIRCKNYEEMSRVAANLLEETIAEKPDAVLGLATGSTPEGMYAELCRHSDNRAAYIAAEADNNVRLKVKYNFFRLF